MDVSFLFNILKHYTIIVFNNKKHLATDVLVLRIALGGKILLKYRNSLIFGASLA